MSSHPFPISHHFSKMNGTEDRALRNRDKRNPRKDPRLFAGTPGAFDFDLYALKGVGGEYPLEGKTLGGLHGKKMSRSIL